MEFFLVLINQINVISVVIIIMLYELYNIITDLLTKALLYKIESIGVRATLELIVKVALFATAIRFIYEYQKGVLL